MVTLRAIRRAGVNRPVVRAADGAEVLAYLRREGEHVAAARPALILLDLNLPVQDGRRVLADIKQDPALALLPVIVLSTSRQPRDLEYCYTHRVNAYLHKPVDLQRFYAMIAALCEFWLTYVLTCDTNL
ncbi:MAG: response regulator [Chloroflexales bacterium]|nr:response regulator [Chloroflexales bacterium]